MIVFQALTENEIQQIINGMASQYQIAIAIAAVSILAAIGVGVAWLVFEKWFTPAESKYLRRAFRRKRPLIFLGGDDGYADFVDAPFSGSEGILQTRKEGRTQEHYTGALPRPKEFDETDIQLTDESDLIDENGQPKKDKDGKPLKSQYNKTKTVAIANFISSLANRRLLLRGAKIPVWLAYRGKAILASLYGLAALDMLQAMSQAKEFKEAFSAVDVVAIKALFAEQWNESQINAQETDAERKGFLNAKKFAGKESLIMFFVVMIVLVVLVICLIAAAYFFGGGGQSAPAP